MILYKKLIEKSAFCKNTIAIEYNKRQFTYEEFKDNTQKTIAYLQEVGIQSEDRIALISENCVEVLYVCFAASFIGCTLVFLYDLSDPTEEEFNAMLEESDCHWIISSLSYAARIRPLKKHLIIESIHERSAHQGELCKQSNILRHHCYIQAYTSGTTGKPKGVCLAEISFYYQSLNISLAMKIEPDSRVLLTGFLFNTTGLPLSFATLFVGACLVFKDSMAADKLFTEIEKKQISHFMVQPAYLEKSLNDPFLSHRALSSLKMIAYGAAPMPKKILDKARSQLSCAWLQGYGLTETCGPITWLEDNNETKHGDSVGQPCPWIKLQCVHDEIVVSGKLLMLGYWNALTKIPDRVAEFHTGDLGTLRENFLYLKGRKKECIVRSNGYTLYPREVEKMLEQHPDVKESVVLSITHHDEEIPILIIRSEKNVDIQIIKQFLQSKLSCLKWPESIFLMTEEFPRNKNGKINRELLKENLYLLAPFLKGVAE